MLFRHQVLMMVMFDAVTAALQEHAARSRRGASARNLCNMALVTASERREAGGEIEGACRFAADTRALP
jgi:hypothetical protein